MEQVIGASHFGSLPADLRASLCTRARTIEIPAGDTRRREGDDHEHLDIVADGIARVYVSAPDGRTMTVRYCHAGAIVGAISLYSRPFWMPATIECLVDTRLLALDPSLVRDLADRDPRVARVLLVELSERVTGFIAEISAGAFATVRQRLARHLLDLAGVGSMHRSLVAPVSQRDLADAAGTSREVVVRVLRDFREAGLVKTGRSGIRIIDPVRLVGETLWSDEAGPASGLEQGWNPGS